MSDPKNTDDIIDSRDVIQRIEELEGEREDLSDAVAEACSDARECDDEDQMLDLQEAAERASDELADWDEANGEELAALKALAAECEGYGDWEHGESLIRDTYFTDYAQQLADDIGAVPDNASWPNNCIDWERAARELQHDYMQVSFDGEDYWMRA